MGEVEKKKEFGTNSIEMDDFGPQLRLLKANDQIRELQTTIRNKATSRGDFVFYADRLIRLIVEEGLNQLPYKETVVTTPTGCQYNGVQFEHGNCGVSIMRSGPPSHPSSGPIFMALFASRFWGEAMEHGLRDCCRSIRIGKILIRSDDDTSEAKVFYAKFPPDIHKRRVLLMYPILNSGNTVIQAVRVLEEHGVKDNMIVLLTIFCTPNGIRSVINKYSAITILTSEVHPVTPNHFGQKYFGTD